jgi:putative transposase
VRVAFALDCCDREAIAHVATTEGIKGEDARDLIITAVESRFGQVNRLPTRSSGLATTDRVHRL